MRYNRLTDEMEKLLRLLLAACLAHGEAPKTATKPGLKFEISFPAAAHADPITGRVFVILSRDIVALRSRRCSRRHHRTL